MVEQSYEDLAVNTLVKPQFVTFVSIYPGLQQITRRIACLHATSPIKMPTTF